jgi:uncharacterized protein YjeT (DUF2065 family)
MTGFWGALLLGLGLCLVLEGLVFVVLPRRLDAILDLVARMPQATRRRIGLGMVAVGVGMVWIVQRGFTLD